MRMLRDDFNLSFKFIIADIDIFELSIAKSLNFETMHIDGGEKLPFLDKQFNCIFCNSVIEHVTIPKNEIWDINNDFRKRSYLIQKNFAQEIRRCAESYYVQTPHRSFPIEAHTWFPLVNIFSHDIQIFIIKILNKFWVKKTTPDWNLLDENQMKELFPDATIYVLKKIGLKKEIIAIKN